MTADLLEKKILYVGGYDIHLRDPFFAKMKEHFKSVEVFQDGTAGGSYEVTSLIGIREVFLFFRLLRAFKTLEPDVVHIFDTRPGIVVPFAVAVWHRRCKVIRTITGRGRLFSGEGQFLNFRWLYNLAQRAVGALTTVTIFQNEDDRDYFINNSLVSTERSTVISGAGVDVEGIRSSLKAEQGGREKRERPLTYLFAGRLIPSKGVFEYVLAGKKLVEKFGDKVSVLIAGAEDRGNAGRKTLQHIKDSAPAIQYRGEVKPLQKLLALADVIVLPSYYGEGVPRILLEAGSAGLPVITTDWPGCRDVVEGDISGILVKPRDSDSLLQGMERMLHSPSEREKFSRNLEKRVEDKFSLPAISQMHIQLYSKLLSLHSKHLTYVSGVAYDENSGQGRFENRFLTYLVESGVHVSYLGPKVEQSIAGVTGMFFEKPKTFFAYLTFQLKLLWGLLRLNRGLNAPIYVRMNQTMVTPALFAWVFRKKLVVRSGPLVANLAIYNKPNNFLTRAIVNLVSRFNFWVADRIIVVTSQIKQWVQETLPSCQKKIVVIGNGAATNRFDANLFRNEHHDRTHVRFCFAGSLVHGQGIHSAIRALQILRDEYKISAELDIIGVGDEAYTRFLKELAGHCAVETQVHFCGPMSWEEVPKALASRDIMLAPFTQDDLEKGGSSALKLGEYLGMNKCVIASSHPDHEFIGKNDLGLLFEADNAADLARVMRDTINRLKEFQSSDKMRRYAVQHLSAERSFQEYSRVLFEESYEK